MPPSPPPAEPTPLWGLQHSSGGFVDGLCTAKQQAIDKARNIACGGLVPVQLLPAGHELRSLREWIVSQQVVADPIGFITSYGSSIVAEIDRRIADCGQRKER